MSKEREVARALIERAHANADCAEDDLVAALMAARKAALEGAANVFLAEPFACKYGPRRIAMILRALAQGGGK